MNYYNNQNNYNEDTFINKDLIEENSIINTEKIFILPIDSRKRDHTIYKNPSHYKIDIGPEFKNISSIELKGAIIPKSSYNVHSTNNRIDFSIGNSVEKIKILNKGFGYSKIPLIKVDKPYEKNGIEAILRCTIDKSGCIDEIIIENKGSGYIPEKPPNVYIIANNKNPTIEAKLEIEIGNIYMAKLRESQYNIGGNLPSGLILEIQNAMNFAVNGTYDNKSIKPFIVRLVSQYPILGSSIYSENNNDTNGTLFNRIQITNILEEKWSLLFLSGPNNNKSAHSVLGFRKIDYNNSFLTNSVEFEKKEIISKGLSIKSEFDYDLFDDPKYILFNFSSNTELLTRTTNLDSNLDNKFATIIFDANSTDTIKDTNGDIEIIDEIKYLKGSLNKSSNGLLKPLKGFDFDQKKYNFIPPVQNFNTLEISFTKYGVDKSDEDSYYNFNGREHLLLFQLVGVDKKNFKKN